MSRKLASTQTVVPTDVPLEMESPIVVLIDAVDVIRKGKSKEATVQVNGVPVKFRLLGDTIVVQAGRAGHHDIYNVEHAPRSPLQKRCGKIVDTDTLQVLEKFLKKELKLKKY